MPRATVGIERRVGRLGECVVHVAAVARVRRPVHRRAHERMREAHAQFELDQPGRLRRSRASTPMPRRSTARHSTPRSPSGSAAAVRSSSCASRGSARHAGGMLCSMRLAKPARFGKAEATCELRRRQAAWQLDQRERVAPVSARICVLTRASSGPGTVVASNDPRHRRSSPLTTSSGNPASPSTSLGSRSANTSPAARPAAGAPRRRASARTPGRAIARRRRRTSAAVPRRRRPAGSGPPDRRGNGPVAALRSGRTRSSVRLAEGPADARAGRASARTVHAGRRTGAPSPTRRLRPERSGTSVRGVRHVPQQRALADSRLTSEDQHATLARPDSGDELFQHARARSHGPAVPTLTTKRRACSARIIPDERHDASRGATRRRQAFADSAFWAGARTWRVAQSSA